MRFIAPDYYENFKCIADACKNSCCIGWEIDVDLETLDFYRSLGGKWREKFENSISCEEGTPHFITDEKERCPFLNQNGLCDLITELGEDALCQICYDHPRFRNFFTDREETGLGLCCEAAAELILKKEDKASLTVLFEEEESADLTEEEKRIFTKREELFDLFQNRGISIKKRIEQAARFYKIPLLDRNIAQLVKKYRSLERLDSKWDEILDKTEQKGLDIKLVLSEANQKIALPTEQLLCYFTYRYFAVEALNDNPVGALNFILEAAVFCLAVCFSNFDGLNLENFTEICRLFSLEVEYSEQNVDLLLKGGN